MNPNQPTVDRAVMQQIRLTRGIRSVITLFDCDDRVIRRHHGPRANNVAALLRRHGTPVFETSSQRV